MKIKLFGFHPHTLFVNGGGETMIHNTYAALKKEDIDVSLFDIWERSTDFDIFHLFGSNNSVAELYTSLSGQNKKLVVSAIDYSNFPYYKLKILKLLQTIYPLDNTYKFRQKLFNYASRIIANSDAEKKFLMDYFEIDPAKIDVLPVCVSSDFYKSESNLFSDTYHIENYLLCVGRINSRKQQIKIIEALNDIGMNLVFIGREDPSDMGYFNEFTRLVEQYSNVHWIGQLESDSEMLISAYKKAKMHILPSNPPEFPGISNLEAGLAGTKVMTTMSPAIYTTLKDYAYYCDPTSESIRKVALKALKEKSDTSLQNHLNENFTWETVIKKLITIYQDVNKEKM